jgi:hypothetical protein
MGMEAGQLPRPRLVASANNMATPTIKLARVPFALALARRKGFGTRSTLLAVRGLVLRESKRRHDNQGETHRNTHQLEHWKPPDGIDAWMSPGAIRVCGHRAAGPATNENRSSPSISDEPRLVDDGPEWGSPILVAHVIAACKYTTSPSGKSVGSDRS